MAAPNDRVWGTLLRNAVPVLFYDIASTLINVVS